VLRGIPVEPVLLVNSGVKAATWLFKRRTTVEARPCVANALPSGVPFIQVVDWIEDQVWRGDTYHRLGRTIEFASFAAVAGRYEGRGMYLWHAGVGVPRAVGEWLLGGSAQVSVEVSDPPSNAPPGTPQAPIAKLEFLIEVTHNFLGDEIKTYKACIYGDGRNTFEPLFS
jgi:hypothetical protein